MLSAVRKETGFRLFDETRFSVLKSCDVRPAPPIVLRRCGAGVELVGVFRLNGVRLSGNRERAVRAERTLADVPDFRAKFYERTLREPGGPIRVCDGLNQFVRERTAC